MKSNKPPKKATIKEVAEYLGKSPHTVKDYDKKKLLLMRLGLASLQNIRTSK